MNTEPCNKRDELRDIALELFTQDGYENVGMRTIALEYGIKAASVYYYFKSKDEILNEIYDYFSQDFVTYVTATEKTFEIIRTGSKDEVFKLFFFTFESDDIKKYKRLVLTVKLVYMRVFQDYRAREIFCDLLSSKSIAYMSDLLKYAQEIGRIDKDFDVETFAQIYSGVRQNLGAIAFSDPNYDVHQLSQETKQLEMITRLIDIKDI